MTVTNKVQCNLTEQWQPFEQYVGLDRHARPLDSCMGLFQFYIKLQEEELCAVSD